MRDGGRGEEQKMDLDWSEKNVKALKSYEDYESLGVLSTMIYSK